MSILDAPIHATPRSILPPLLVGVAILWLLGAGRFTPKRKKPAE